MSESRIIGARHQVVPTRHPVATIQELFLPRRLAPAYSLLDTPGLELTYNGRGALMRACTEIAANGKRDILMPAFHCPSGITPAIRSGLRPVFYRIRRDLTIDYEDLFSKIGPRTAAVLAIHFFGIAADLDPLKELRAQGIRIVEDWSHSFMQGSPPHLAGIDRIGDYCVYSFWKLVPSGVGGALLRSPGSLGGTQQPSPPAPLGQQLREFKQLLEEALDHSDLRLIRALFKQLEQSRLALKRGRDSAPQTEEPTRGEDRYPYDPRLAASSMPGFARRIIESSDLAEIARKRRRNFQQYGKSLSSLSGLHVLYPQLPAEACPWVYPVLLKGRDSIDHCWRDAGVALHTFGRYLHSALFLTDDQETIADAQFLAENLLCLAIHQNIASGDIARAAQIISSSLALRHSP